MKQLRVFAIPLLFCSALSTGDAAHRAQPDRGNRMQHPDGVHLLDGTVTSATDITAPFTTTANSNAAGAATITVSAPFPFCKVTTTADPHRRLQHSDGIVDARRRALERQVPRRRQRRAHRRHLAHVDGAPAAGRIRRRQFGSRASRFRPPTGRSAIPKKCSITRTGAITSPPRRARRSWTRSMDIVRGSRTSTAVRTAATRR